MNTIENSSSEISISGFADAISGVTSADFDALL